MKKHIKIALIVASCLSIGATFLMARSSQAICLDPPPKNGIQQNNEKKIPTPDDTEKRVPENNKKDMTDYQEKITPAERNISPASQK